MCETNSLCLVRAAAQVWEINSLCLVGEATQTRETNSLCLGYPGIRDLHGHTYYNRCQNNMLVFTL